MGSPAPCCSFTTSSPRERRGRLKNREYLGVSVLAPSQYVNVVNTVVTIVVNNVQGKLADNNLIHDGEHPVVDRVFSRINWITGLQTTAALDKHGERHGEDYKPAVPDGYVFTSWTVG